nr:hypothetical protein CFP56_70100 [Quercus suber]
MPRERTRAQRIVMENEEHGSQEKMHSPRARDDVSDSGEILVELPCEVAREHHQIPVPIFKAGKSGYQARGRQPRHGLCLESYSHAFTVVDHPKMMHWPISTLENPDCEVRDDAGCHERPKARPGSAKGL